MNEHQQDDVSTTDAHVLKTRAPLWMLGVVTGIFGLLYAYSVWSAVLALVQQANGSVPLSGVGWAVMILPIAVPVIFFGVAVAFGFRKQIGEYSLILLAGFALVQVFWMNILSFMMRNGDLLLATAS